jgi:glycerol-3-phosphate acyltransferase PlsY
VSGSLGVVGTTIVAGTLGYLIGSIPFAYIIVRLVTGEDITAHGTGNVGSMNVRRTTGSWGWFVVAVLGDGLKGLVPVAVAKALFMPPGYGFTVLTPTGVMMADASAADRFWLPIMATVFGVVMGHNYSVWMALIHRRFGRTGKGLATGAGALLAYDWRYFVAVVVVGLTVIAITRYMMAGQVAAAITLPATALLLRSPDWPFALLMGIIVYAAHHKRFVGMLRGREPKLYVDDGSGPRG